MNDPSTTPPAAQRDYERQLREMNDALLVSSVRQHELIEQAQKAEAALAESEEQLRRAIEEVAGSGHHACGRWRGPADQPELDRTHRIRHRRHSRSFRDG